jgi:hypothetical protein
MRGVWLAIVIALIGSVGCTTTPKREMKQPHDEELVTPPEGTYGTPVDYTRDQPVLQPKPNAPGLNTGGPGMGGPGGPGAMSPGARH